MDLPVGSAAVGRRMWRYGDDWEHGAHAVDTQRDVEFQPVFVHLHMVSLQVNNWRCVSCIHCERHGIVRASPSTKGAISIIQ